MGVLCGVWDVCLWVCMSLSDWTRWAFVFDFVFSVLFNWQKNTFLINQSIRSFYFLAKDRNYAARRRRKIILHHQGNNWAIKILSSILMLDKKKWYLEWHNETFALFGWYKNERWTEKSISLSYSPLSTRTYAFSINGIVSQVSMLVKSVQYLN